MTTNAPSSASTGDQQPSTPRAVSNGRNSLHIPLSNEPIAEEHEHDSEGKPSRRASIGKRPTDLASASVRRGDQRPLITNSQWAKDADLKRQADVLSAERLKPWATLVFAYQSLGVIYGDIGTSPLYVYATTFPNGVTDDEVVLGALSIIIWTFTLVVCIKYVTLVMRMDDEGEGGTFSIYSLLCRHIGITPSGTLTLTDHQQLLSIKSVRETPKKRGWWQAETGAQLRRWFRRSPIAQIALMVIVVVSVGLVLADGVLTPAISVMSAVAGLKTASDAVTQDVVVGVSEGLLIVLFLCQSFGTHKVAHTFSPIVTLWLLANTAIGIYNIVTYDAGVFKAISPHYIVRYFQLTGYDGWASLGGIMLCITGTEAMFADMGHFTRKSIQLSAWAWVYPALMTTYIGQAAWLMQHKDDVANTFYSSIPHGLFYPMLILATLAAIVASQALITGSFSIIRQSMRLSLCPKLRVHHTSGKSEGQIYIAEVNYILMLLCIIVVGAFQDTVKLGNAYGVAVMAVMIITTCLALLVELIVWEANPFLVALFFAFYFTIEAVYWSANLLKVPQGGWFPLVMAAVLATIMLTWWAGERRKRMYSTKYKARLEDTFSVTRGAKGAPVMYLTAQPHHPLGRTSGLGIYYSDSNTGTPALLQHFLSNVHSLHQVVVLMTVRFLPLPLVARDERLLVRVVPTLPNFYQVVVRYGYQETVDHGSEFVHFMVARITQFVEMTRQESYPADSAHAGAAAVPGHEVELAPHHAAHGGDIMTQKLLSAQAQAAASNAPQHTAVVVNDDDFRYDGEGLDFSDAGEAADRAHGGIATKSVPTGGAVSRWPPRNARGGLETRSARHSQPATPGNSGAASARGSGSGSPPRYAVAASRLDADGYKRGSPEQSQFVNPSVAPALGEVVVVTGAPSVLPLVGRPSSEAPRGKGDAVPTAAAPPPLAAPTSELSSQSCGSSVAAGGYVESSSARALLEAYDHGVVYYVGKTVLHVPEDGNPIKKVFYNQLYGALDRNSWADRYSWGIPTDNMLALDITFTIY